MSGMKPFDAITLKALTISAGEKFPEPRARDKSFGNLDFVYPKFSK